MREYIVNQITERIPVLLMKKLEYVCNPNYIGDLIGKRVYMSVMNYVLEFNVNSEHKPKNNVGTKRSKIARLGAKMTAFWEKCKIRCKISPAQKSWIIVRSCGHE